jgi:hypothetical protein
MKALAITGAVLCILVGGGATLCWMVFIVAGMANSSPQQEANLWRFFWAVAAGGLVCAAAAMTLIVHDRPGLGSIVGATPLAALVGFLVLALAWPT